MNIQDRKKTLTVEELRRRYNLDALDKDRKAIKLQKDQLNKVDAELNDFVELTTKNLKELQDQVDGNITTWFFNGVPTLETEPSSNWTTDEEKINHLGDLYYDQDTGYAYRWAYENNTYVWSKIVDADVVEALAVANAAQDTADSKRRVFVNQPVPPYDIGDIWIKEDTDLYRCRASRSEGNFNTADWIRATNYTDDTVALGTKAELDQFKTQVTENYVSNATLETTVNSINGKVEETYTYVTTVENQVVDITKTTNEVEGNNNLYITDSLESNALEYHIEGKSEQETRSGNLFISTWGQGNIDATTGFNITASDTIRTEYIEVKPNYLYTMSRTITTSYNTFRFYDKDKNFLGNQTTDGIMTSNKTENRMVVGESDMTFTILNENVSYIRLTDTSNDLSTIYTLTTSTPTPDYPSEIKTIPSIRNWFDYENENNYIEFVDASGTQHANIEKISNGIRVSLITDGAYRYGGYTLTNTEEMLGKTYTISCNATKSASNNGTIRIFWRNNTTATLGSEIKQLSATGGTFTVPDTIPTNMTNIVILFYGNLTGTGVAGDYVDYTNIMLEEGSIAHDYVPYGAWAKVRITDDIFKNNFENKTISANGSIANATNRIKTVDFIKVNENTNYKLEANVSNDKTLQVYVFEYKEDGTFIQRIGSSWNTLPYEFTTSSTTKNIHLLLSYTDATTIDINDITNGLLYTQEKEVLIDLSKPNLLETPYTESNKLTATATRNDHYWETDYYAELEAGKTYTFSCKTTGLFGSQNSGFKTSGYLLLDKAYTTFLEIKNNPYTFTPTVSGKYYLRYDVEKSGETHSFWDFKIYEGYTDYYELSSINDTKDTLDIVDGQVVIDKSIEKIDSYNGETISTDYISTTGELTTGATVYYVSDKVEQIILPNTNIPLFDGVNHITLVDDLETTTSIKYLRNTPISSEYALNQQLDETNTNLANTTNQTNQNASDINATNTNLNNNYYTKPQIDIMNSSTQEVVTQIKNTVETTTNATNLQISILQEQLTNGVTSVKTETGYTFDKDGLKIQKSDSEMSSLLDNDGLVVKRNKTEVLTVRSSGVETENLTVRTYFTIGDNTRVENYKGGTGFFYIGGAN